MPNGAPTSHLSTDLARLNLGWEKPGSYAAGARFAMKSKHLEGLRAILRQVLMG